MNRQIRTQRIVALFLLGVVLLNYPLLSIFSRPTLVGGLPLLYLYLFLTWLAVILLASRLIDTPAERGDDARGPKRPP